MYASVFLSSSINCPHYNIYKLKRRYAVSCLEEGTRRYAWIHTVHAAMRYERAHGRCATLETMLFNIDIYQ